MAHPLHVNESVAGVAVATDRKIAPTDFAFDVFGKTPFEHELTAEPADKCAAASRPLKTLGTWERTTDNVVVIVPATPIWMLGPTNQ